MNPNEVVDVYGADVLRTCVLFMSDYEQAAPWSESSVKGCKRFIDRVFNLQEILTDGDEYSKELMSAMHKTVKKVSEDIEQMKYNTAIAALMTLLNKIYENGKINRAELKTRINDTCRRCGRIAVTAKCLQRMQSGRALTRLNVLTAPLK